MKYVRVIMALFFLFSCKSKQAHLVDNTEVNAQGNCPENGTCHLEVLKNKNLLVLKDNIGKLYPSIVDGDQLVLKFKFEKNTDLKLADGHYIEEVFIELDPNNLQRETTHLKTEKLLFARLCFCRGQTGYYRIRSGHLSIKNIKDDAYQIDFDFKIEEVPQITTTVTEIFSLK